MHSKQVAMKSNLDTLRTEQAAMRTEQAEYL
jgi:hypothetical protein